MSDKEVSFLRRLGKKTRPGRKFSRLSRIYTWSASPVKDIITGEITGYRISLPCYVTKSRSAAIMHAGSKKNVYWVDLNLKDPGYRIDTSVFHDNVFRIDAPFGVRGSLSVSKLNEG